MTQQQVSTISVPGATITGSNTLNIDPTNGLSVVGGIPGLDGQGGTIDPTESITIRFLDPTTGIVLTFPVHGAFGSFPQSQAGEFAVQGFDAAGNLIASPDLLPVHVTVSSASPMQLRFPNPRPTSPGCFSSPRASIIVVRRAGGCGPTALGKAPNKE